MGHRLRTEINLPAWDLKLSQWDFSKGVVLEEGNPHLPAPS